MRPIRVTGITGNSPIVPLDVYAEGPVAALMNMVGGVGVPQMTTDSPYDVAAGSITWANAPAAVNGVVTIPAGIRAIRATGMAPTDVMVVSQPGLI